MRKLVFVLLLVLVGCAETVPLDESASVAPGECVVVEPDGTAWRNNGPDLSTFVDPFADGGDLRDQRFLDQFGAEIK